MTVHKLTSAPAWVIIDLEGAERSLGTARLAPKVLQSGGVMPARSVTYTAASFGLRWGGAAAGINATPEDRAAVLEAFRSEVAALDGAGALALQPGPGLEPADLDGLAAPAPDPGLVAAGAVAAAGAAVGGGLDGQRLGLVGDGPWPAALAASLGDLGDGGVATVATVDLGAPVDVDVLFVAGPPGVVDHEVAARLGAGVVVPLTPIPVTARALAVLSRAGGVVLPDFITTAAPLIAAAGDAAAADPVSRVAAAAAEVAGGTGTWMAAAERAEAFLSSWRDPLPFGRPLA